MTAKQKTNESRLCHHIAKAAGCEPAAYWLNIANAVQANHPNFPWQASDIRVLPVTANIMPALMYDSAGKMDDDLIINLIGDPGQLFWVQDLKTVGPGSVWLMCMEAMKHAENGGQAGYACGWPVRLLTNAFEYAGEMWQVTAIQMPSLFRKQT